LGRRPTATSVLKRKCSCGNWESGPRNTANVFKDKQKWLDFIKTEGLKGGAVIGRRLEQDYQRLRESRSLWFLTKKGNIVSVDVPRPSSPELKKMLENEESRLKQIT